MKFYVIGMSKYRESRADDGHVFNGANLYCENAETDHNMLFGSRTERFWISADKEFPEFSRGDLIEVYYNRYGRLDSIQLLAKVDAEA